MNDELIRRIDFAIRNESTQDYIELLADCRAALSRKYVPMTDDDFMRVDISTGMHDPKEAWAYERNIEAEVIRRAGLELEK